MEKYHYNSSIWNRTITTSRTSDEHHGLRSATSWPSCRCMPRRRISVWTLVPLGQVDEVHDIAPHCLPVAHLTHTLFLPTQLLTHVCSSRRQRPDQWRLQPRRHRRRRPQAPSLKARCDAPSCLQWMIRSRVSRWRWRTTRAGMDLLPSFVPFVASELASGRFALDLDCIDIH
jgi:hypothetical protein